MCGILACVEILAADPQGRRDYLISALENQHTLFTEIVRSLHGPLEQPGHEVLIYEGPSHEAFILPALHRDIVRAHNWILTPAGERLEDGPLTCEGGTWFYPLQHPYDPAMQDIISFAMVVGPIT